MTNGDKRRVFISDSYIIKSPVPLSYLDFLFNLVLPDVFRDKEIPEGEIFPSDLLIFSFLFRLLTVFQPQSLIWSNPYLHFCHSGIKILLWQWRLVSFFIPLTGNTDLISVILSYLNSASYYPASPVSLQGPHQRNLLKNLLKDYNRMERPVGNDSHPLTVIFSLSLIQIMDVVGVLKYMRMFVWCLMICVMKLKRKYICTLWICCVNMEMSPKKRKRKSSFGT